MNVLMVMAHPDDEVLFGWPVLRSPDDTVSLLVLTNNRAKYGQGPSNAAFEVARDCGIKHVAVLNFDTNVYRLPTRNATPTLRQVTDDLRSHIASCVNAWHIDTLFTHNPMGEYGHGDHRLVFNLVSMFDLPAVLTDICFTNPCHVSSCLIPKMYRHFYSLGEQLYSCELDELWYEKMKAIYERHHAWSWSGHEPIRKCNLFLFH